MWFALFQLSKQFFRRGDYLRFFTSVSSADLLFNLQKLDAFFSVSKVLLVLLLLLFHSHTSIPHFDYSALNPVVLSLSFAASIVYEWFVLPFYISLEDSVSMIGENDYATVSCICRASDHPDQGSRDFFFCSKENSFTSSAVQQQTEVGIGLCYKSCSFLAHAACYVGSFSLTDLTDIERIQVRNNTAKRNKNNKRAKGGRVWKSGIRSPTFFLVLCFFFSLLVVSKRIVRSLSTYSSNSRNRAIRVGRRRVGKSIFLHWCSSDGSHYSCLPPKKIYTAYRSRTKAGSAVFQTSFFRFLHSQRLTATASLFILIFHGWAFENIDEGPPQKFRLNLTTAANEKQHQN